MSDTSFALAFDIETVVLIEIGSPLLRTQTYQPRHNEHKLRLNLDLPKEMMEKSQIQVTTYQH